MAPVQCKIRFSVGTAKVSAEGERGLTAEGAWRRVTSVMRAPAPSQGQRETVMSRVNCGENPARLPAFMLDAFSATVGCDWTVMSLLIAFSQLNKLWNPRGDLEDSLADSAEQESAPDRPRFLGQGVPRFSFSLNSNVGSKSRMYRCFGGQRLLQPVAIWTTCADKTVAS